MYLRSFLLARVFQGVPWIQLHLSDQALLSLPWVPSFLVDLGVLAHPFLQPGQIYLGYLWLRANLGFPWYQVGQACLSKSSCDFDYIILYQYAYCLKQQCVNRLTWWSGKPLSTLWSWGSPFTHHSGCSDLTRKSR